MERRRARVARSDSGRLIWARASFVKKGTAANAPIDINPNSAARRSGRLDLSPLQHPNPKPNATAASGFEKNFARGNSGTTRGFGSARADSYFDECRTRSSRAEITLGISEGKYCR